MFYRTDCLCGRSTDKVPEGVLDPCGTLKFFNIIIKKLIIITKSLAIAAIY